MNWPAVGLSVGLVFLIVGVPLLITRVFAIVDPEMKEFWRDSKGFSWLIGVLTIIVIFVMGAVVYGISVGLYNVSKDILKPTETVVQQEVKKEEPKKIKIEEEEEFKDIE